MKEGELIDTNTTFEQEIEEIAKNPPSFFIKALELKNAIQLYEKTGKGEEDEGGEGNEKKKTKGSNLENGNVNNKQTD